MWFKIRVAIFLVFVLLCALGFVFFNFGETMENEGSIDEAVKLRTLLEPITTPEAGEGCHPDYGFQKFDNGEWVMGIGRNSHSTLFKKRVGGTVLFKDSRGQMRYMVGHVCGSRGQFNYTYGVSTLDEFYTRNAYSKGSPSNLCLKWPDRTPVNPARKGRGCRTSTPPAAFAGRVHFM